jgi:excisionase family DNA binding protein
LRNYMNTHHIAKILGVNIQTVRHYIRKGELQAARVGKRYVVTQEDIDAFLERRKESLALERLGLSEKGQETVARIREDAARILIYLKECPGASADEISKALTMKKADTQRALLRLEGKKLARSEPAGEKADKQKDPWYAGPQASDEGPLTA